MDEATARKSGILCEAHSAIWNRWSGGPDGWGPGNPMPHGVTPKLIDDERHRIQQACRNGHGCTELD